MLEQFSFRDLDFRDLYINEDPTNPCTYNPTRKPENSHLRKNEIILPQYEDAVQNMIARVHRQENRVKFDLAMDGYRLRVLRRMNFDGTWSASLRYLPDEIPILEKLNYAPEILAEISKVGRRKGLLIVSGATGSGKTTGITGMLKYWLDRDGGTLVTIEDPVEFVLMKKGKGLWQAHQWEVTDNSLWGEVIQDTLRWAPDIIFVGEVRTAEAGEWLLNVASTGHLVVCTTHGSDVITALSRILQVGRSKHGDMANSLLADSLVGVMCQQIINGKPQVEYLTCEENSTDIRALIRQGDLQKLGNIVTQQANTRKRVTRETAEGRGRPGEMPGVPFVPQRPMQLPGPAIQARPSQQILESEVETGRKKGIFGF